MTATLLTCPGPVSRPPVAGHDVLTRTRTIHFHDPLRKIRPAAPGPADFLSMRPCVPTHGGIARLLVAWIRLPDALVLASLPSRRV
jgi:hypothetical protein